MQDASTAIRPGYDWVGQPVPTDTGPICGSCQCPHIDVQAIRVCFTIARQDDGEADACHRAEVAAERHLEDRGYDDARAQEDYEARNGMVSFEDAYRAACPWLFTDES